MIVLFGLFWMWVVEEPGRFQYLLIVPICREVVSLFGRQPLCDTESIQSDELDIFRQSVRRLRANTV